MKVGTLLLGLSFFISKLLGLLRDTLLASQFGAGTHGVNPLFNLDTYYAAFRVPDLLFNLLSYGILSAAFVPLFVEILKKEGREDAVRFTNQILHTVCLSITIISTLIFVAAPYFMSLFVSGFSPEQVAVTAHLTRIMMLTPLFFTISGISAGVGNATNRYLGIALAPIFYNLGILGGIFFLAPQHGVVGVAWGVTCGAFFNMLVQLPPLIKAGYRYSFPTTFWSVRVKEMVVLSLPRIFSMSVHQISLVIDTIIASTLASGSITVINLAANLESLPTSIIGISVAVVSFGTLSHHAAEGNFDALAQEVKINLRRILMLLIPITAGMLLLRTQIATLVLLRGKFSMATTLLTANTLGIFLSGLMFGGIVFLMARAFNALKNTKTPTIVGIIVVTINVLLSLFFTKVIRLNTYGLALANSCADVINASLMLILLTKRLKTSIFDTKEVLKYVASALVMAVAVYGVTVSVTGTLAQSIIGVVVGVVVYAGMCMVLKSKEVLARLPRAFKEKIGADAAHG